MNAARQNDESLLEEKSDNPERCCPVGSSIDVVDRDAQHQPLASDFSKRSMPFSQRLKCCAEVIAQSWEFGGYGGDQETLMGLYLLALGASSGPPPEVFRRGDANGDGGVNIADAIRLLNALFVPGSPQPDCFDSSDVNDDGSNNVADAVFLLNALFVPGSANPPPPGAIDCGEDPTDDTFDCVLYPACP